MSLIDSCRASRGAALVQLGLPSGESETIVVKSSKCSLCHRSFPSDQTVEFAVILKRDTREFVGQSFFPVAQVVDLM